MNYIGIFDSGVGGLGIFLETKKLLPKENILYLADTKNCPYGEKSTEEIKIICKHNVDFLIKHGAKIVVVACNTASVSALEYLRLQFPNIPIIGVVPVVKTAAKITKNKKIGILATKRTVESSYLKNLVQEFCPKEKGFEIHYQAANELVEEVENGYFCHQPKTGVFLAGSQKRFSMALATNFSRHGSPIIDKVLRNLDPLINAKVDVVALGCTHFPFLRNEIESILGKKVKVLDSNSAVARQIVRVLVNNKQLSLNNKKPIYKFFTSGDVAKLQRQARDLIGFDKKDCFFPYN